MGELNKMIQCPSIHAMLDKYIADLGRSPVELELERRLSSATRCFMGKTSLGAVIVNHELESMMRALNETYTEAER